MRGEEKEEGVIDGEGDSCRYWKKEVWFNVEWYKKLSIGCGEEG